MSGLIGGAGSKSGVVGTTELEYEEGTWTPTILGSSGNPTQSYHHQVGRYTRWGNTVHIQCNVEFGGSGISAGSGNLQVGALPFTLNSTSLLTPSGKVGRQGGISTKGPDGLTGAGGTVVANCTFIDAEGTTYCSAGNVGNGAFFYASMTYHI